jgi:hypothetical protein
MSRTWVRPTPGNGTSIGVKVHVVRSGGLAAEAAETSAQIRHDATVPDIPISHTLRFIFDLLGPDSSDPAWSALM